MAGDRMLLFARLPACTVFVVSAIDEFRIAMEGPGRFALGPGW